MVGFEEMRDELLERIEDLLKRKQYTALRDLLADLEPADIASLFEDLDEDSIPLLFRLLPAPGEKFPYRSSFSITRR